MPGKLFLTRRDTGFLQHCLEGQDNSSEVSFLVICLCQFLQDDFLFFLSAKELLVYYNDNKLLRIVFDESDHWRRIHLKDLM